MLTHLDKNNPAGKILTKDDISHKVAISLVTHVYNQTNVAMAAALVCATVIFMGLYSSQQNNTTLFIWYGIFVLVTFLRIALVILFKRQKSADKKIKMWRYLYVFFSAIGGMIWGLLAVLLFKDVSTIQQTLMLLMLAGVTAGAVQLSSAIPSAIIAFLIFTIFPFIIMIASLGNFTYLLFDAALSVYLIYSITLVLKAYKIIETSFILQFENNTLLENLSKAKQQLEVINSKLEHAATHDALTQVANRNLFQVNLSNTILRAQREHTMLALFYIDLDDFKSINDHYGHHVGDFLLITTVERLKNYFGTREMIARIGGDELTVILENVKNLADLTKIASELCQLIAMPIKTNEIEFKVSVSIGIGIYPNDGVSADALLRGADACMYYVKERGGNNFYFNDLIEANPHF